jgi:hypothetical protein
MVLVGAVGRVGGGGDDGTIYIPSSYSKPGNVFIFPGIQSCNV